MDYMFKHWSITAAKIMEEELRIPLFTSLQESLRAFRLSVRRHEVDKGRVLHELD